MILPVGIGIEVGILAHVLAVKRHRLVVVGRGVAVLQVHGVGQLAVFECVDRFGQVGRRLPADGSLVGDGEAFGRAAFGRHQNDAVGRARTVDRRRRCVFEDGDGFDEYGIDAVQTALDPVDEHQRGGRAAAERIDTADADGTTVGTRGARRRGDGHARSHTLQGDRCRNNRTLFEGRGIDRRYRTRDVDFFLGAVTDDDDIVDLFAVALKSDLVKGFRGDLYGRFPIPDVGNRQLLALGGVYGKFTFGVGRSPPPSGRAFCMTITVAPTSGAPSASVTIPFTAVFWANATTLNAERPTASSSLVNGCSSFFIGVRLNGKCLSWISFVRFSPWQSSRKRGSAHLA